MLLLLVPITADCLQMGCTKKSCFWPAPQERSRKSNQYQTALMVLERERERKAKQYDQIRVQLTLSAQAWTAAMKAEDPFAVKQVRYLSVVMQTCCIITVYCILYYRLYMCQSMLTCTVHIETYSIHMTRYMYISQLDTVVINENNSRHVCYSDMCEPWWSGIGSALERYLFPSTL